MYIYETEHYRQFIQGINQLFYYIGTELYSVQTTSKGFVICFTENDYQLNLAIAIPDGIAIDMTNEYNIHSVLDFYSMELEAEIQIAYNSGPFIQLLENKQYPIPRFFRDVMSLYEEYAIAEQRIYNQRKNDARVN